MGLDYVELVMEIQATLGVNIADSDATEITTVGSLFDVILELSNAETAPSGTSHYSGDLWERYLVVIQQFTDILSNVGPSVVMQNQDTLFQQVWSVRVHLTPQFLQKLTVVGCSYSRTTQYRLS